MKPTLGQVFAMSLLALAAVLAMLFYVVFDSSRSGLTEGAETVRDGASREIGARVSGFLAGAPDVARQFQSLLKRGLLDARDPGSVERALFSSLLANPNLGEVTFTYARDTGPGKDGNLLLADQPRGQVSLVRSSAAPGQESFRTRHVYQEKGVFVADRRIIEPDSPWEGASAIREAVSPPDPTTHPTFTTTSNQDFYGKLIWSDLQWSQIDIDLPEQKRRVEVSIQQVMTDAAGKFAGVLRVGLLTRQLDQAVRLRLVPEGVPDPHRIFICDNDGRLITRLQASDRIMESRNDLRIDPSSLPADIRQALANPQLRAVSSAVPSVSGSFSYGGVDYLTTFRQLPGTQEWIVGVVVPRSHYLGGLLGIRDRLLEVFLVTIFLILIGGAIILRAVKRAHARIVRESLKMNAFDFSSAPTQSAFRDVNGVLESLEKAKTAMRAMGKYVPVDLVKRLYRDKSEPVLGGQPTEVSILFTDIKDFTTLSEQLPPDTLANALGQYLDVMAGIIQRDCHGTIDKYIGDSIMTLWNAPEPVADHARMACLAALRCRDAGRSLCASPQWLGLPPFVTRFGLHQGTALVGHFGAHDRMNYTAIGDAVNLASRLEGLNKQYGTAIIASETIVEATRDHFDFRLLDRVAVKGKHEAIRIYELLGLKGAAADGAAAVADYERAFELYQARDFAKARELLAGHPDDPPGRVLAERCTEYLGLPPADGWDGIHIASSK